MPAAAPDMRGSGSPRLSEAATRLEIARYGVLSEVGFAQPVVV